MELENGILTLERQKHTSLSLTLSFPPSLSYVATLNCCENIQIHLTEHAALTGSGAQHTESLQHTLPPLPSYFPLFPLMPLCGTDILGTLGAASGASANKTRAKLVNLAWLFTHKSREDGDKLIEQRRWLKGAFKRGKGRWRGKTNRQHCYCCASLLFPTLVGISRPLSSDLLRQRAWISRSTFITASRCQQAAREGEGWGAGATRERNSRPIQMGATWPQ